MVAARVGCRRGRSVFNTIVLALCIMVAGRASAADAPREGWRQLDWSETTIAGAKVYYEKALEPNLPAFEREFAQFLAEREKIADMLAKRDEIIRDINQILGVVDPNVRQQSEGFAALAGVFSEIQLRPHIVRVSTIKQFLRAGGRLPDFTYDRQADTAWYRPRINTGKGVEPPEVMDLCVPIDADQEFRRCVSELFDGLRGMFGAGLAGVTIHEVTEMTLLSRVRPTDPYWRWFSDGFANAITCILLEKHVGQDTAAEFAAGYEVETFRHLEKGLNLRYWMLTDYCVPVNPMPVEAEAQIGYARYAYATLEARAIIERHGLGCIDKIIDAVTARDSRTGVDLLEATKQVTGEDVESRLLRYQSFTTLEEGRGRYAAAFDAALADKDQERMFLSLMRGLELQGAYPQTDTLTGSYLLTVRNIARLLFQMGHEAAGDQAMQGVVRLLDGNSDPRARAAVMETFMMYALDCGTPAKAADLAEEMLKTDPQRVLPLTVRMMAAFQNRDLARARALANEIRPLAKKGSREHQLAGSILTIDPNQPSRN